MRRSAVPDRDSFLKEEVVQWLLAGDPWIVYRTLVDLRGKGESEKEVIRAKSGTARHPLIKGIFARLNDDGYWGKPKDIHTWWPKKDTTFWILPVLADFGLTVEDKRIRRACEYVLSTQLKSGGFGWDPPDKPGDCHTAIIVESLANLGSYSRLEKVIMFLVTGIFISYLYFFFELNIPLSGVVVGSIVPTLDPKSFYYAEAIIGASIMPTYLMLHSGLVYEKGWVHHHHKGIEDLIEGEQKAVRNERIDSIFSLLMGTVLNIVIIACAAFLISGREISTYLDVASPFYARFGDLGLVLFSLAFGFAGISAVMTVGLSSVYNSFGFLGIKERMDMRGFRQAFFLWSAIAGIASLLPNGVGIMIFTQYLNGALLLLVVVPLVLIARDTKLMGPHKIGTVTTMLALATVAITTLLFVSSLVL